jgi:hypothetical protein
LKQTDTTDSGSEGAENLSRLNFEDAVEMARTIVAACIEVRGHYYFRDYVLAAFEETIRSVQGLNESADTETDYFNDGLSILRHAVLIAETWQEFWSDVHHNGQPSRWLKITEELILHGKTESLLLLKQHGDWLRSDSESAVEERWELHQLCHKDNETQMEVTPFILTVRPGRWVDALKFEDGCTDKSFCAFVYPGLEVLGYRTPVLYSVTPRKGSTTENSEKQQN